MTSYLEIARTCMAACYSTRAPSPAYVKRGTHLLLGTAATESRFTARRQSGISITVDRGAWGLLQTQSAPLLDSLRFLKRHENLAQRAAQWLYGRPESIWPYAQTWDLSSLLRVIHGDDRMAFLFARIHYMRFPEPIPAGVGDQANYYKEYYNTTDGAGSADKYVRDYMALVLPMLRTEG